MASLIHITFSSQTEVKKTWIVCLCLYTIKVGAILSVRANNMTISKLSCSFFFLFFFFKLMQANEQSKDSLFCKSSDAHHCPFNEEKQEKIKQQQLRRWVNERAEKRGKKEGILCLSEVFVFLRPWLCVCVCNGETISRQMLAKTEENLNSRNVLSGLLRKHNKRESHQQPQRVPVMLSDTAAATYMNH